MVTVEVFNESTRGIGDSEASILSKGKHLHYDTSTLMCLCSGMLSSLSQMQEHAECD